MPRLARGLLDRGVMLLRVAADGVDDLAAAEDFQLDVGMAALELEAIDVNAPLPLETPRVALADHERDRGEDEHRDEGLDQKWHRCRQCSLSRFFFTYYFRHNGSSIDLFNRIRNRILR